MVRRLISSFQGDARVVMWSERACERDSIAINGRFRDMVQLSYYTFICHKPEKSIT